MTDSNKVTNTSNRFDWKSVSSLRELKHHIVQFLNGKHKTSPWYHAPVNSETVPLLGNLIQLNNMGFITTQGQPTDYIYPVKHHKTGNIIIQDGGQLAEIKHGYMDGILDGRQYSISKLIKHIQNDRDTCALIYKFINDKNEINNKNEIYNLPGVPDVLICTKRGQPAYAVTRYVNDVTEEVEYYTKIQFKNLKGSSEEVIYSIKNKSLRNEIIDNCYYIIFIDNREPTESNPRPPVTLEEKIINMLSDIADNAILNRVLPNPIRSMRRTRRRLSRRNRNKSFRR
jgi:hypothetical protein